MKTRFKLNINQHEFDKQSCRLCWRPETKKMKKVY